eukprot:COSAG06_NODE_17260_length_952_cov_1.335287_2_plen_49_part_01
MFVPIGQLSRSWQNHRCGLEFSDVCYIGTKRWLSFFVALQDGCPPVAPR